MTDRTTADSGEAERSQLASVPITVRWRDLDAFNHVNNATFLSYLEEARLLWMAGVDGPWLSESFSPVVAATHVNYRRQIGWPGVVRVELSVERVGNSSLTIAHRLLDDADRSIVYADGNAVVVWIDPRSGRSVALPDAIRRASV